MVQLTYSWNGDAILKDLVGAAFAGIDRASSYFHTRLVENLNISAGPYTRVRTRNTTGGLKGSSYTAYSSPSAPGETPHKRTGWLQRNTFRRKYPGMGAIRVGYAQNAPYGVMLELGTRRMDPRPGIQNTLRECMPRMQVLLKATR